MFQGYLDILALSAGSLGAVAAALSHWRLVQQRRATKKRAEDLARAVETTLRGQPSTSEDQPLTSEISPPDDGDSAGFATGPDGEVAMRSGRRTGRSRRSERRRQEEHVALIGAFETMLQRENRANFWWGWVQNAAFFLLGLAAPPLIGRVF
ncbi:MAG: hypothetical protein ACK4TL_14725 [Hyphomicrobiaceae bacterium]